MFSEKVGFFCKSFKPDFDHLANLLDSFQRHNVENLPLTLSLPKGDIPDFRSRFGSDLSNVAVVADQDYAECDLSKLPGWYGQQVCKLMSWAPTGLDHYAVLDSDCYFISPVRAEDLTPPPSKKFIVWGSSLRTVIHENGNDGLERYIRGEIQDISFPPVREPPELDASILRAAQSGDTLSLEQRSGVIYKLFGAVRWYYYQPSQVFSRTLLLNMRECLSRFGLNIEDAIKLAPWEYNWYGEYTAAFFSEDTFFRVSPTLHIAPNGGVQAVRRLGYSEDVLAKKFTWVQMAARHMLEVKL